MTLISQSVSLGSSQTASSTTASTTTTATAAGATTGAFNQTLTQMMTGGQTGSAGTDANGSPLVMVLPLIATGESTEAPTESLVETLAPLLQNLEKLDDQVAADPALLATLQAWIQQVQQFLQGDGTNQQLNGGETTEATGLTALAANPATLRFALQDALSQLANVAEQASGDQKSQVTQLLQSLQSATAGTGAISDEQWNGVMKAVELADGGDSQAVQPSANRTNGTQTVATATTDKQVVASQQQASQGKTNQQGSEGQRSSTNILVQSAVKTTATDEASAFVDATEQADSTATDNQTPVITTAGQLSVQTQGTTPSAPAQPVVHVRQFAKEMTEFVVQKLDIVKHTGLTEATIMLRPDHLGQLEVKLIMQNGHLVAQFMTEHSGAKDLLEQQMSQLRSSLQSQGIQVDKVEVTHNESLSSHMYQDGRGSGANQQQQQSNQRSKARGREESEDAMKVAEMAEELRNWTAEQRADDINRTGSFTAQA
ncbi:flagellar hook-length control protein FliK [Paenibacillus sp. CMM36]